MRKSVKKSLKCLIFNGLLFYAIFYAIFYASFTHMRKTFDFQRFANIFTVRVDGSKVRC